MIAFYTYFVVRRYTHFGRVLRVHEVREWLAAELRHGKTRLINRHAIVQGNECLSIVGRFFFTTQPFAVFADSHHVSTACRSTPLARMVFCRVHKEPAAILIGALACQLELGGCEQ